MKTRRKRHPVLGFSIILPGLAIVVFGVMFWATRGSLGGLRDFASNPSTRMTVGFSAVMFTICGMLLVAVGVRFLIGSEKTTSQHLRKLY
ncbi:MAG TPA: hypothetical protein VMS77_05520 [Conexivisphaerales archaeon]|nr:hypothetical protein [Conexivisphaerales archaeon]